MIILKICFSCIFVSGIKYAISLLNETSSSKYLQLLKSNLLNVY